MPSLSFYPRKYVLFTVPEGGAKAFALGMADDGIVELGAAPDGTATTLASCPKGAGCRLLFGPLWLSVYVDGALVRRHMRPNAHDPYRLSHDADIALIASDPASVQSALPGDLDTLDRAQLLLLGGAADDALALARRLADTEEKDTPFRALLEARALRHAFEAYKQEAMALAGLGERANALAAIRKALGLYTATNPSAHAHKDRPRRLMILADLSLPQCRHYRIDQKLEQLAAAGIEHALFDQADSDAFIEAVGTGTLALFYRVPLYPKVRDAIAAAKAAGLPCLYELDDLLFDEHAFPGPRTDYGEGFSDEAYQELLVLPPLYQAAMEACDGVIASTPALAAEIRHTMAGKPVFVHPNGLGTRHAAAMAAAPTRTAEGPVRLFYGSGTRAMQQDFVQLADHVLAPLMARRPDVHLVLAGHVDLPPSLEAVSGRIERSAPESLEAYWERLAGADINLAPLTPSRFNDSKSAIKWLEAAMFRIPSVLSMSETYKVLITDGEDGYLAADWQAWLHVLEALVTDAEARRRMGDSAFRTASRLFGPEVLSRNIADIVTAAEALGA